MKVSAVPNIAAQSRPAIFNPEICNGWNTCVDHCPSDVFIPNPGEGRCPIILHPDECWYCGTYVNDCLCPGAVQFNWSLQQRAYWKAKETGWISQI